MQITLMCQYESGSVAFLPERIEGIEAPERRYNIANHHVTLSGYDDPVLHHDAGELLRNPVYRMPTPQEQEAMAAEQMSASQIQEAVVPEEDVVIPPPSEPEQPLLTLPTTTKKKASGG